MANKEEIKVVEKLIDVKNDWKYYKKKPVIVKATLLDERVMIKTLEGNMIGECGDYLIKGIHGELYPCKPDIFKKTYEEVK